MSADPRLYVLQAVIDVKALKWQDRALCAEIGGDLFFAEVGHEADATAARRVCAHCPVKPECLEYALDMESQPEFVGRFGIYGGTTPRQRCEITRARRKAA